MTSNSHSRYNLSMQKFAALRHTWFGRNIVIILALAAIIAAIATYGVLTKGAVTLNPKRLLWLLLLNLALLITLAAVIGQRVRGLWRSLKSDLAGSKLQRRVVYTFSLVTVLPTVIVAIFSVFFFNLGIQAWFNERVSTAVQESLAVAEAYLAEHRENIRADAIAMANDLNQVADLALTNPRDFNRNVIAQSSIRLLTEAMVFQRNRIIAQGRFSFALAFEAVPMDVLERANTGEVVLLTSDADEDKVRAVIKLQALEDTYLLVGRLIDNKVLTHMTNTQGAVNEYRDLKAQIADLQLTFSLVFLSLALMLLLAAIWYGLVFAARLINPISGLVVAAERVRGGDYAARVKASGAEDDEMAILGRTFNRMTEQLDAQRSDLIKANRALDERRRFTEAVLSGVSAGVLALDAEKRVNLANRSAEIVLGENETALKEKHVSELLSGIQELLVEAETSPSQLAQGTLSINKGLTLHVRVAAELLGEHIEGFIVTFDDITPLISAQRNAAWSDVARRVAHEIKNPLTPIALSAERLKRKYLKMVGEEEAETFTRYTDTIGRHVADIGRMVEEFVGFARMPNPVFKEEDIGAIIKKVVFSEQVAHANIEYRTEIPEAPICLLCDERQMTQVLGNLLKNAAEALEAKLQAGESAVITTRLTYAAGKVEIAISDNGPGFPSGQIEKILEPYVTTRAKGTGLGLAITKKIIEDHQGKLELSNVPEGGACVTLSFLQQCDINAAN